MVNQLVFDELRFVFCHDITCAVFWAFNIKVPRRISCRPLILYVGEGKKKSAILGTRQTARRSLLQWCGSLSTGDRSSLKAQYLSWSLAVMHTDKDSIWANPEDSKAVFVPASRSCLYLRRLSL